MRESKGITLTILIITIIVLAIIISVGVTSSIGLIDGTKQNRFISELKIVQSKVDIANKEISLGSIAYNDMGKELNNLTPEKISQINIALISEKITEDEKTDFRYFDKIELEKIGITDLNKDVLINFKTKKVISVVGFKLGNNIYYSEERINER